MCIDEVIYIFIHNSVTNAIPKTTITSTTQVTHTTVTPAETWKVYSSQQGKFLIKYPSNYSLTGSPGANPESIQIISPLISELHTNFLLTIQYKYIATGEPLSQLIQQNTICSATSGENGYMTTINGKQPARIYVNTPCGQYNSTVIYTVNNSFLYILTINSKAHFSDVKPYSDQLLATLQFR